MPNGGGGGAASSSDTRKVNIRRERARKLRGSVNILRSAHKRDSERSFTDHYFDYEKGSQGFAETKDPFPSSSDSTYPEDDYLPLPRRERLTDDIYEHYLAQEPFEARNRNHDMVQLQPLSPDPVFPPIAASDPSHGRFIERELSDISINIPATYHEPVQDKEDDINDHQGLKFGIDRTLTPSSPAESQTQEYDQTLRTQKQGEGSDYVQTPSNHQNKEKNIIKTSHIESTCNSLTQKDIPPFNVMGNPANKENQEWLSAPLDLHSPQVDQLQTVQVRQGDNEKEINTQPVSKERNAETSTDINETIHVSTHADIESERNLAEPLKKPEVHCESKSKSKPSFHTNMSQLKATRSSKKIRRCKSDKSITRKEKENSDREENILPSEFETEPFYKELWGADCVLDKWSGTPFEKHHKTHVKKLFSNASLNDLTLLETHNARHHGARSSLEPGRETPLGTQRDRGSRMDEGQARGRHTPRSSSLGRRVQRTPDMKYHFCTHCM